MPTWPRPTDIHFDHQAADAALVAIAAMRFTLEWAWAAEHRSAQAAVAHWEGAAADAFGASHGSRRASTEELAARLGLLAVAVGDAIDDAVAEQARIDAVQAEWDAQRRLELRAEADATAVETLPGGGSTDARPAVPGGLR